MSYKKIEAAREVRLWIGQIIVPAATVAVSVLTIPEIRESIGAKFKSLKNHIHHRQYGIIKN